MIEDVLRRWSDCALAMQLTYSNIETIAAFIREHGGGPWGVQSRPHGRLASRGISIGTTRGIEDAYIGDWILWEAGEFTVCPSTRFAELYKVEASFSLDDARTSP